jgi:Sec7-like guanine-nucleotide exchange factor
VLLSSRIVKIDSIAEIIGGKTDRAKKLLEAYLDRQDYMDCNIEKTLRSFLESFRMAGVDSQVVFNILEKFGDKYYEFDTTKIFTSGAEAYSFAYLLIVLQTCQHNASIKEKTSLERFISQAKEMVPESYDTLPTGFVEHVFNRISD